MACKSSGGAGTVRFDRKLREAGCARRAYARRIALNPEER